DGAVHDRVRQVTGSDPEPLRDTRPEPFEHDVGTCAQRGPEVGIPLEIPHDRLLAAVERCVPTGGDGTERIALRRLDADDTRAPLQKLAAGVRARQVPREIDDESARKCVHYAE